MKFPLEQELIFPESLYHSSKRRLVMKSGKQRCCSLCWKPPEGAQSFVFFWQIVTEEINATFLLVNTIKMIGMLLNVVHFQAHKNISTRESDGFYNHSSPLTMLLSNRNDQLHLEGFFFLNILYPNRRTEFFCSQISNEHYYPLIFKLIPEENEQGKYLKAENT